MPRPAAIQDSSGFSRLTRTFQWLGISNHKNLRGRITGWWFQPLWVNNSYEPAIPTIWDNKNVWNHQLVTSIWVYKIMHNLFLPSFKPTRHQTHIFSMAPEHVPHSHRFTIAVSTLSMRLEFQVPVPVSWATLNDHSTTGQGQQPP